MTISMYQASVPRFTNMLGNLSNVLDKAQAHVDARKLDLRVVGVHARRKDDAVEKVRDRAAQDVLLRAHRRGVVDDEDDVDLVGRELTGGRVDG